MSSHERGDPASADPVKDAMLDALKRVLDPLLDLMFDAGVTVQDFNTLARERAVRVARERVLREGGRASKSRVAIVTGLSRPDISKILSSLEAAPQQRMDHHPARRVLAAWHDDPIFLAPNGAPAELKLFGRKPSFEQLVVKSGGGIPVRAMLDELVQLQAVEVREGQYVKPKLRVPISTGFTPRSIAAVGDRGTDLLNTLAFNIRERQQPLFESTALIENGDPAKVRLARREIAEQGANFINTAMALLKRSQLKRPSKTSTPPVTCRFGVTVYYFQDDAPPARLESAASAQRRRKNFRRRQSKPRKSDPHGSI